MLIPFNVNVHGAPARLAPMRRVVLAPDKRTAIVMATAAVRAEYALPPQVQLIGTVR